MILAEFEPNKMEEFPYVIAQLWRPDEGAYWANFKIYFYGNKEVLFGNKTDAENFLKYVSRQKRYDGTSYDNDPNNPWKIYKIYFEEVLENV